VGGLTHDGLSTDLAAFHAVAFIDDRGLARHLFDVPGKMPGVVDLRGVCTNADQARSPFILGDSGLRTKVFSSFSDARHLKGRQNDNNSMSFKSNMGEFFTPQHQRFTDVSIEKMDSTKESRP